MDTFSEFLLAGLGVFAVIIGGLVWWYYSGGPQRRLDRKSTGWPLVAATVENYEIEYSRHEGFVTALYYSYSVNSEFYSGRFNLRSRSESAARDTGDQWIHKKILVRHQPDDPAKSVFIEKDSQMSAGA
jgi:hypothetical protein